MRLAGLLAAMLIAAPAAAVEQFSLTVYHFNVQYVQGGLVGFPDGKSENPVFDLNDAQVQDQIIKESFEPLLDIYLKHPEWGADFEMQGYMVDVIRERHPGVLVKMKQLAANGKVEFDSFHWADQLWTAYPRLDMERSHELVKKSFEAAGLPLSTTVWTQEGQFAMGQERFMRERGLKVAVLPRNLFRWTQGEPASAPLYRMSEAGDVYSVVTTNTSSDKVQTIWTFVDDGELAVTYSVDSNGKKQTSTPYFGKNFLKTEAGMKGFEEGLVALADAGVKHTSISHYVQRAIELGESAQPLPQIMDGTWQPNDTWNVYRWMGGAGLFHNFGAEADNAVLTSNVKARKRVVAAERYAASLNIHDFDGQIEQAWRSLLLGECSDSTGWNPWLAERVYSTDHAAEAQRLADEVLQKLAERTGQRVATVAPPTGSESTAPFEIKASPDSALPPHVKWTKRDGSIWDVEISFDAAAVEGKRTLGIELPRTFEKAVWTGSLEDDKIRIQDLSSIRGSEAEIVSMPLATGLLGIGEGRYLIQQTASVHIAPLLPRGTPVVRFVDETSSESAFTWKFTMIDGSSEAAIAEAHRLNLEPDVKLEPVPKKCGCSTTPVEALFALAAVGMMLWMRRPGRV